MEHEENIKDDHIADHPSVSRRIKQWNRAIPEAGYITLGTIRFGVRLSNSSAPSCLLSSVDQQSITSTVSTIGSANTINGSKQDSADKAHSKIKTLSGSHSHSNSSTCSTKHECISRHHCCCLNSSGLTFPWKNTHSTRTRLPKLVSNKNIAKNRSQSTPLSALTSSSLLSPLSSSCQLFCIASNVSTSSTSATSHSATTATGTKAAGLCLICARNRESSITPPPIEPTVRLLSKSAPSSTKIQPSYNCSTICSKNSSGIALEQVLYTDVSESVADVSEDHRNYNKNNNDNNYDSIDKGVQNTYNKIYDHRVTEPNRSKNKLSKRLKIKSDSNNDINEYEDNLNFGSNKYNSIKNSEVNESFRQKLNQFEARNNNITYENVRLKTRSNLKHTTDINLNRIVYEYSTCDDSGVIISNSSVGGDENKGCVITNKGDGSTLNSRDDRSCNNLDVSNVVVKKCNKIEILAQNNSPSDINLSHSIKSKRIPLGKNCLSNCFHKNNFTNGSSNTRCENVPENDSLCEKNSLNCNESVEKYHEYLSSNDTKKLSTIQKLAVLEIRNCKNNSNSESTAINPSISYDADVDLMFINPIQDIDNTKYSSSSPINYFSPEYSDDSIKFIKNKPNNKRSLENCSLIFQPGVNEYTTVLPYDGSNHIDLLNVRCSNNSLHKKSTEQVNPIEDHSASSLSFYCTIPKINSVTLKSDVKRNTSNGSEGLFCLKCNVQLPEQFINSNPVNKYCEHCLITIPVNTNTVTIQLTESKLKHTNDNSEKITSDKLTTNKCSSLYYDHPKRLWSFTNKANHFRKRNCNDLIASDNGRIHFENKGILSNKSSCSKDENLSCLTSRRLPTSPPPPGYRRLAGNGILSHSKTLNSHQESVMDKRRNTFDRWPRFGFGRRSASNPPEDKSSSTTSNSNACSDEPKRNDDRTERLRELTLLIGTPPSYTPSTPPPIPPPRKPRHSNNSCILERSHLNSPTPSTSSDTIDRKSDSDTIQLIDKTDSSCEDLEGALNRPDTKKEVINSISYTPKLSLYARLRPNKSASNLEHLLSLRGHPIFESPLCDGGRTPPLAEKEDDSIIPSSPKKVESRPIIGSYALKPIPYRSASFSQVDFTSGKYIHSAIGAFKAGLKRKQVPAVIDNTNLTLPRKKNDYNPSMIKNDIESECQDAEESCLCDIESNKGCQPEFNINQHDADQPSNKNDVRSFQRSDVIFEEDNESSPKELKNNKNPNEVEKKFFDMDIVQASVMILDTPSEKETPIVSPIKDEYLQTATTCLIPVPVYECVSGDWNSRNANEQTWIHLSEDEKLCEEINVSHDEIIPFELDMNVPHTVSMIESNTPLDTDLSVAVDNKDVSDLNYLESLPAISVTPGSSGSEELSPLDDTSNNIFISSVNLPEVVEVRKRLSKDNIIEKNTEHCNNNSNEVLRDTSDKIDEKRRIDKSKRRKGIYIQWPTIEPNKNLDSIVWDDCGTSSTINSEVLWDVSQTNEPDKVDASDEDINLNDCNSTETDNVTNIIQPCNNENTYTSVKMPEELANKSAQCDNFNPETETPDSDTCRGAWDKIETRRQSLTCQSSDEKDEQVASASATSSSSSGSKRYQKITYLRSDSISDNESDRTPTPRERTSQSPVQCESDLKRYSKRPLRGPYGQMLEAEMKKPAKINFDGLLGDLNRHEGFSTPIRDKSKESIIQSFDDSNIQKLHRTSSSRIAHLPIPIHTRAASTPAQTDTGQIEVSGNHKRFPSSSDTATISLNSSSVEHESKRKDDKKLSLDSNCDNSIKYTVKEGKQNSFIASNDKLQKRSLDELRLSSRSPDRSISVGLGKKSVQATPELLAELLKGSSEKLLIDQHQQTIGLGSGVTSLPVAVLKCLDTRTHVVIELFNTEQSYVDSLATVVVKYLNPLKSAENAGIIDAQTVDEIFYMVPAILDVHERFLDELRRRLDAWDKTQIIGDAFIDVFSMTTVLETYTSFVNNWNRAKNAIRTTSTNRPAFAKFLEAMAREHKGKLSLDNLLIKPVQKFPNYELILTRLKKHTKIDHPDQKPLDKAIQLVHDILLHLNCKEREAIENGQREAVLRELESVIEGITELVTPKRKFLLFDLVTVVSGQSGRKERGLFLFNDILIITSIKRRSGTIRKPTSSCPGSVASTLDTNKYKFLMKVLIEHFEIVKTKDENVRKIIKEIETLTDDSTKLQQILDIVSTLRCSRQNLEDNIKDLQRDIQRQLSDRQTNDSQLCFLEIIIYTPSGIQNMPIIFSRSEKRTQWEKLLVEIKQKLVAPIENYPVPEFLCSLPIRKTRAGLQFSCAAPTNSSNKDVWVCNSDGYVGQVCVLSLVPEAEVTSCNGVCNARILCIAAVPGYSEIGHAPNINLSVDDTIDTSLQPLSKINVNNTTNHNSVLDVSNNKNDQLSSVDASCEGDVNVENVLEQTNKLSMHNQCNEPITDAESNISTMWIGTEDGCIHIYSCDNNVRTSKNRAKMHQSSPIYSILYFNNKVYVALASGEVVIYRRHPSGWSADVHGNLQIGTNTTPVTRFLIVNGKIWCSVHDTIKIVNPTTDEVVYEVQLPIDSKPITNMTVASEYVWISMQNSALITCFHSKNFGLVYQVNLAPPVNKMLSNCDDIIRQHKAACLRVTALLTYKDFVWVGTSAGVLLTVSSIQAEKGLAQPVVTGLSQGHTGHVRFLTYVESCSIDSKTESDYPQPSNKSDDTCPSVGNTVVISGGDGYENFGSVSIPQFSDIAGKEDSTNHLLMWQV